LEPNTDVTLWFNKAKATANYDSFIVTSAGVMYKATLDWQGKDAFEGLEAVNNYLALEKYNYREASEGCLVTLSVSVGAKSDYAPSLIRPQMAVKTERRQYSTISRATNRVKVTTWVS
jgi:hypothetical protein